LTFLAASISAAVRWRTKTGLPRQVTVMDWPSDTGARSTSIEASASVSAAGFMLSTKGQAAAATPTAPTAPVAR